MPSWDRVQNQLKAAGSTHDVVRRQYLKALSDYTSRNTIVYYSGWMEKAHLIPQGLPIDVNDSDKNGFMVTVHEMDRSKGLDLLLHTPGGDIAATESLVDYLRSLFGTDLRVIVPQLAMSAGTMIALAASEIVMGKHSSLGPVDPQTGGMAAHGVVEEFERAKAEIAADPTTTAVWQPIVAKYSPTLIGECEKAIKWSSQLVESWLQTGMFKDDKDKNAKAKKVLKELANHALTLSHSRHISADKAEELGIKVLRLEDDQGLQDAVLSVHHACILTLGETPAFKIIENHMGVGFISAANVTAVVAGVR